MFVLSRLPASALQGLAIILKGGFNNGMKGLGQVLYLATPLIMTGLSVGFAFRTGLFNIGAPGQLMVGGAVSVWVGVSWSFLPGGLHWIAGLMMGMLAGGLWGLVPGFFKASQRHEVIVADDLHRYVRHHF